MKKCADCKIEKSLSDFWKNRSRYNGFQSSCIACMRTRAADYYKNAPLKHREKVLKRNKLERIIIRRRLFNYLLEHPCVDCGESDPVVLEFDHVDPATKTNSISIMLRKKNGWNRILKEITLCVVRCANCHKKRTSDQFGWYKSKLKSMV